MFYLKDQNKKYGNIQSRILLYNLYFTNNFINTLLGISNVTSYQIFFQQDVLINFQ